MITDKKTGAVIATTKKEKLWFNVQAQTKNILMQLKQSKKAQEKALKMSQREVYNKFRDEANKNLLSIKDNIKVQSYFLNEINKILKL